MNKLFTLFLLSLSATQLPGQPFTYTFSRVSQPYTELEGGRVIDLPTDWFQADFAVPLGFDFPLFGEPVDTLYSLFDGPANLSDKRSEEDDENELLNPRHLIFLDVEYDMTDRGELDSVKRSSLTYHVLGAAPNRIGVFQYANVGFYSDLAADSVSDYFTNFQLWLYERTGTIETHYGPGTRELMPGDSLTPTSSMVVVGDYSYDEDTDLAEFTGFYYLSGDPANPTFEELEVEELDGDDITLFLDFLPVEGTVYRFDPSESTGLFDPRRAIGTFGVFPNPTFGRVSLSLPDALRSQISRLEVFDGAGRRVRDLASVPAILDLSDAPRGLYSLRLTTDTGRSLVGRLVKR